MDHERLDETAYLLKSPANARRLLESVEEVEADGGPTSRPRSSGAHRAAEPVIGSDPWVTRAPSS